MSSIAEVRRARNMPFLKRGMCVIVNGREGVLTSGYGHNIRVRFVGQNFSSNCHPKWQTIYKAKDGTVIADYTKGKESHDSPTAAV